MNLKCRRVQGIASNYVRWKWNESFPLKKAISSSSVFPSFCSLRFLVHPVMDWAFGIGLGMEGGKDGSVEALLPYSSFVFHEITGDIIEEKAGPSSSSLTLFCRLVVKLHMFRPFFVPKWVNLIFGSVCPFGLMICNCGYTSQGKCPGRRRLNYS